MLAPPTACRRLFLLLVLLLGSNSGRAEDKVLVSGDSVRFDCDYDASTDKYKEHEFAVNVQPNCNELPRHRAAQEFNLLAAVYGKSNEVSSVLCKDKEFPALYTNSNHTLVQRGFARVLSSSNTNKISVEIKADPEIEGYCFMCGQMTDQHGYVVTRKYKISVVIAVQALLQFLDADEKPTTPGARKGGTVTLRCTGRGTQPLKIALYKGGEVEYSTSFGVNFYSITDMSMEKVDVYGCGASSSNAALRAMGRHSSIIEQKIDLYLPPKWEVNEVLHFSDIDAPKEIALTLTASPQPNASSSGCWMTPEDSSGPRSLSPSSCNEDEYTCTYTFSATIPARLGTKSVNYTCSATNMLGSSEVRVMLTAMPPMPNISSGASSKWHNSYELTWHHHKGVTVDEYVVEVRDMRNNTNRTETLATDRLWGSNEGDVQQKEYTLYNMSASTPHRITVKACNRHGCSDASRPVEFNTSAVGADTYNDPSKRRIRPHTDPKRADAAPAAAAAVVALGLLLSMSVANSFVA